jgi:transposase
MKLANEAVDNVRREEVKTNPILIGTRYYWLHNPENFTVKQRNDQTKISKRNLKTARAYRYKLALQEVFKTIKSEDAEIELKKLISWGLNPESFQLLILQKC